MENHTSVVPHLKTDILECKVKWALGNIAMNKARGGDGIPAEYFKFYKKLLLWYCTQYSLVAQTVKSLPTMQETWV